MSALSERILGAAQAKFPGQKLELRLRGNDYELLVGDEGEHCYRVEPLRGRRTKNCYQYDFEQMD